MTPDARPPTVAYFSMEIAVADAIPTYSGGLGVLAGDHLRAAADLGLPLVALTLLYRSGYFHQSSDALGNQVEEPVEWSPEEFLEPLDARVRVELSGRVVIARPWRYRIVGNTGHVVAVYFLDTDLEENDPADREITAQLYAGDRTDRLRQEALLGLGGVALLEQLGLEQISTFHMNEGHSALLTYGLLRRQSAPGGAPSPEAVAKVRAACVFTTHTPVPAGHDVFDGATVRAVLGATSAGELADLGQLPDDELNMTHLGMAFSRYANGVSLRHGELSREMFPSVGVHSITNGVHAGTWVAPPIAELFDRHLPGWRDDNTTLRSASAIPLRELGAAHSRAKGEMVDAVASRTGVALDPEVLTLGLARRATAYKRNDLLLHDPERLAAMAAAIGPLQIVYGGKAHPNDAEGKAMIRHVHEVARSITGAIRIVFVDDYSLSLARILCAGTDLWVNTPIKPYEASGTSGMKAAMNGVPSLSILDGWWIEGAIEGVTGWSIGDHSDERDDEGDASTLYRLLEEAIAPLYYERPEDYAAVRRSAISLNGSYFTTERMVRQYAALAYDERPAR